LSIDPKRGKTIDLYTKEREKKLHADCQSRSPKPSSSAEPSSSAWRQARLVGVGEAGGGRRGWWRQMRLVGTGEADEGGQPLASCLSPTASMIKEVTGPNS